ncbi:MAG: ATP-binding protein [Bacteroidota bacterium]
MVLDRCFIIIYDTQTMGSTWWMSNPETPAEPIGLFVKYHEHPAYLAHLNAWKERKIKWVYILEGDNKKTWDQFLFADTELTQLPSFVIDNMRSKEKVYLSSSFNHFGYLSLASLESLSNEQFDILLRFAKVFDSTYTRFNDLQKAEAQAREAKIEAALEKVRSRSLAMHHSEELKEVVTVVFQKLQDLGFVLNNGGAVLLIFSKDSKDVVHWVASPDLLSSSIHLAFPFFEHPINIDLFAEKKKGTDYYAKIYSYEEKNEFYRHAYEFSDYKFLPDELKTWLLNTESYTLSFALEEKSAIVIFDFYKRQLSGSESQILKRFSRVFEQAYVRFLDLQKAEGQAREATIEAALERVRGKAMAMHNSTDLAATIGVFYHELENLDLTPRRCGVGLINKETRVAEISTMNATSNGQSIELIGELDMTAHPVLVGVYEHWLTKTEYRPILRGNEIKDYYQFVRPQMDLVDYPEDSVQYGYFFFFSEGGVYAWTEKQMNEDEMKIYRRFTSVLSLTYKRYKDLQNAEALARQAEHDLIKLKQEKQKTETALTELQATQKQLIQSEKMASLGELTAGIAHEIQNPLNFVNNFSEVSKELLDEMKAALESGDAEEVKEIMNDVIQNLEKINHHGKRADGIVKGMLQHSRSSTNQKEPTNINALADEYLRLAYHGLRAKEKSFNALLETNYDETIGKIEVIPQDIGRVILNLITNAFYAVKEKSKTASPDYQPTVWVSTKRKDDQVVISVEDNGNGVPQIIVDKIFQPFFTTKPTGQGTGLGLSLAYDIVKAHGGELKVLPKDEEGSEFVVLLPN